MQLSILSILKGRISFKKGNTAFGENVSIAHFFPRLNGYGCEEIEVRDSIVAG